MKIDLQIHSTFSDGCYTPSELVALGKKHGLALMAITDHDTVEGVAEAVVAGKKLGVKVISGVEITTMLRGKIIHLLGYNFDIRNAGLQELLARLREYRKIVTVEKIKLMNKRLGDEGRTPIDLDDFVEFCGENFCAGKTASYLTERGIMNDRDEASVYFSAAKLSERPGIRPPEAIKTLHDARGMMVLGHPFAPKISLRNITGDLEEQTRIIRELKDGGLDGLECYQACHGKEETERALQVAKELDLLPTVGSDWHGPIEVVGQHILNFIPHYVDMIGDVVVPERVARALLKKLCQ